MNETPQPEPVAIWEETVAIPTYVPAPPDLNPMFVERRVDQGASGRVYPHPFTDRLSDQPVDRPYRAVYLENPYLRLMVLPEIGGRIHEAVDKATGYHFVYRQHVIKPALIGRFGPWISGGAEFNWPQHHRPATFLPVHHCIQRHADGSATLWLGDHDPLERMKGMVGICLYPDRALLEMKVRLYNRTPLPRTFLWWVNWAVHVHDEYQVVFPPDVTVVTDHSKRAMAHYPIARESYYGVDYGAHGRGTDISWYRHIPVPTSYFVWESTQDFFGGYDHRAGAGVIHVADHHIAPGKKMFTWGTGGFGQGWERQLTDADGPYIELMAGVYTDNQPDFSWIQPTEAKTFSQFWYPIHAIGPPKQANDRGALSLELARGRVRVGAAVTEPISAAQVVLRAGARVLLQRRMDLEPGSPFVAEVDLPAGAGEEDLLLLLLDDEMREVVRYAPRPVDVPPLPEPRTPPPSPEAFNRAESLYLTGLHLGQYHHPTIEPEPYWDAAVARDCGHARAHTALGLLHLQQGLYVIAEDHLRTAIRALTRYDDHPRDGEPFYHLGLALRAQGRLDEAYAAFYKATWSRAWQAPAHYALAQIDCLRQDLGRALDHLDRSLVANAHHSQARDLQAAVLRRLGRLDQAAARVADALAVDPLDLWARNELVLQSRAWGDESAAAARLAELSELMDVGDWLVETQAALDIAYDYAGAGLWDEAEDLLRRLLDRPGSGTFPLVWYALGYLAHQSGRQEDVQALYATASAQPTDYAFAARQEEMAALEHAQSLRPEDGRVAYTLGNLYYDRRRYHEAIANWELAARQQPDFATPWRNLGIAHYNVRRDAERSMACCQRAFEANPCDGRVLSELDELARRTGAAAADRLARLEAHLDLVTQRDDLSLALVTLYNQMGQPDRALDHLTSRQFHPWEGGTGHVWTQYTTALFLLAESALEAGDPSAALGHIRAARRCPDSLGEGKHLLWPDAHLDYLAGLAHQALGDMDRARESFGSVLAAQDAASSGPSELAYYQALALRALGRETEATVRLEAMLASARQGLEQVPERTYADSVPEFVLHDPDPDAGRRTELTYLIGLAHQGLGQEPEAERAFRAALHRDPNHLGALHQLRRMGR